MHRYLIIVEKAGNNYSAYSPDLPGCIATGATQKEVKERMHEVIEIHIKGLREDGHPLPKPHTSAAYIAVQD